jgi:hypothetical protein
LNKPIPILSESDLARFWSKVDKRGECWLWAASLSKYGYGQFSIDDYPYKAHRVSYAIVNGDPGELNVNHACDMPACVNPLHLWTGTQQEGMDDKVAKGRQPKGETQVNHILTERQVKSILASNETQTALAERYSVHRNTIGDILKGKTWNHLKGRRHKGPLRIDNTTGMEGAYFIREGQYVAKFVLNKKRYYLGSFDTIDEAAKAIAKRKEELTCKID